MVELARLGLILEVKVWMRYINATLSSRF